jgi:broad specificity phosphatase PhoE
MGRGQARALGEAFRKHGVRVDRIVSAPVCHCLETGQLMAVRPVETSWALLLDGSPRAVRVLELKEMVSSWRGRDRRQTETRIFADLLVSLLPTRRVARERCERSPTIGGPRPYRS